jgi:hypothetical protein
MDKTTKYEFLLFILTVFSCSFWIISRVFNVYSLKFVGGFFEFGFIPMLILFFILPVLLLIQVFKSKKALKSYPLFALLIQFITILFLTTRN